MSRLLVPWTCLTISVTGIATLMLDVVPPDSLSRLAVAMLTYVASAVLFCCGIHEGANNSKEPPTA